MIYKFISKQRCIPLPSKTLVLSHVQHQIHNKKINCMRMAPCKPGRTKSNIEQLHKDMMDFSY